MFLSGFCVLKALTKRVLGSHKMAGKTTASKARGLQKNWASPEDQKDSPDLGRSGGDMLRQKCGGSQRRALSVLPWHIPRCLEREWPERNERERERQVYTVWWGCPDPSEKPDHQTALPPSRADQ